MDIATFRLQFPEFSSGTDYPNDLVSLHLAVGEMSLDATAWGDFHDRGLGLFIAHNLALDAQNQATAAAGGTLGKVNGVQTSKSVDKVSASYDAGAVTYEGAAFWNMTSYGVRFWQLARIIGAGGRQL